MADPNRMNGTFLTSVAPVLPSEPFGRATGSPLPRFAKTTYEQSRLRGLSIALPIELIDLFPFLS